MKLRYLMVTAGVAVLIALALGVGVPPTRAYLDQRSEIARAEAEVAELSDANEATAKRIESLRSDEEIERIARQDFGLAYPGEELYRVIQPAEDSPWPDVWPFSKLRDRLAPE